VPKLVSQGSAFVCLLPTHLLCIYTKADLGSLYYITAWNADMFAGLGLKQQDMCGA